MQTKVGICRDGGIQVDKGLSVAIGGSCGLGKGVEMGAGFESIDGVRRDFGAVAWAWLVEFPYEGV